jgi:hypothetical protein
MWDDLRFRARPLVTQKRTLLLAPEGIEQSDVELYRFCTSYSGFEWF